MDIMEYCVIPLPTTTTATITTSCISTMPCWDVVELNASSWKDKTTVVASRTCWNALAEHLGIHHNLHNESENHNNDDNDDDNLIVPKRVCEKLEWHVVAKAVRAQFFGKNDEPQDDPDGDDKYDDHDAVVGLARPSTMTTIRPIRRRLHTTTTTRTYPLEIATRLASDPRYKQEPARIHAALFFLRIMESSTSSLSSISSRKFSSTRRCCCVIRLFLPTINISDKGSVYIHCVMSMDDCCS